MQASEETRKVQQASQDHYPWPVRNASIALALCIIPAALAWWASFQAIVVFPVGACVLCHRAGYSAWDIAANMDMLWKQASPLTAPMFGALTIESIVALVTFFVLSRGRTWVSGLHIFIAFSAGIITLVWVALVAFIAYPFLLNGLHTGESRTLNLNGTLVVLAIFLPPIGSLLLHLTRHDPLVVGERNQYEPAYRKQVKKGDM